MINRTVSWPLLSILLLSPAVAQDQQIKPDVNYYTLDNGLQLVVIPDNRAPVVSQVLWYKVGAADDPVGQSGVAHFFEHLMFKGTEKYPSGELDRFINSVGGDHNAFTSSDVTAYLQYVPSTALPQIMDMEADRMRNLVLPESVIAAERSVVENERRQMVDFDPFSTIFEQLQATRYQNHPYRVPIIGWAQEIAQLDREDALGVYERFYSPNNAVLVIAGDVVPEDVLKLAEETYGKIERGPDLEPRVRPQEPKQVAARTVTMEDARVTQPNLFRMWNAPSYRTAEAGEAEALQLLDAVLSGGTLSRLTQELSIKSNDAATVYTSYSAEDYDSGNFFLALTPQQGITLEEIDRKATAEIDKIIKDGVTPAELERIKKRYIRNMLFRLDNVSSLGNYYGSWLVSDLSLESLETLPDRIQAVTSEDIQAVAEKYLKPELAVTAYLLPKSTAEQASDTEAAPANDNTAAEPTAPALENAK